VVIDALDFAFASRVLQGTLQASKLTRLCQDLPVPQDTEIRWRLAGRRDQVTGQLWLDIQAEGQVRVMCQRCLSPFLLALQVDNTVGLVRNQAQLDAMDELEASGEGTDTEYVVADQHLDVLGLLEDELILVLPYAPRHQDCPQTGVPETTPVQAKPSPFAVLEQLRKH